MTDLVEMVRNAGVVGAGGAGFPAYRKIGGKVDYVIANGAECEPLLFKDKTLMEVYPGEIIEGISLLMEQMQAKQGIIAVKSKNREAIRQLSRELMTDIIISEMDDVYPAGDEYEVVYFCTGHRIPAGGIPLQVGAVVQNVETLYNICQAARGYPVTHSMVSVHGCVRKPVTAWFPVGMSFSEVVETAGGTTEDGCVILDGGAMMGRVVTDFSSVVTKLTSGIIVIPGKSRLAVRKSQPEESFKRFGKSACDQCSDCTELCPRYLLGYPVQPHLVMRSLLTTGPMSHTLTHWAQACCECNVCSLWACPEELDPRNVCVVTKRNLQSKEKWLDPGELQQLTRPVHPLKEYRQIPITRLIRKLGLHGYTGGAPFYSGTIRTRMVSVPLVQHIGAAPEPVVNPGDEVLSGDVIASPRSSELSVPVHSSINGTVKSVNNGSVVIEQFGT